MTYDTLDLQILKTVLANKKYALDFISQFNESLFSPDLWRFAKIIFEHLKVYKDVPTKRVMLDKFKGNDTAAKYITAIFTLLEAIQYDEKDFQYDLEKLKNRYSQKLLKALKDNINSDNVNNSIDEVKRSLNNISAVSKPKTYEQKTLKLAISEFRNRYKARKNNPEHERGIFTGYTFLDYALNGLRPSEMLLVGADTGAGKSTLLASMAKNMWLAGNDIEMTDNYRSASNILYFSLEMPYDDMLERLLSSIALVPQKKIRDAELTDEEEKKIIKALKFIERYPYEFNIVDMPRGCSVEDIERIYNDSNLKLGKKYEVVIVDYLSLLSYEDEGMDDWLKLAKVSEKLSEFGRASHSIVLTAAQLNAPSSKTGESNIGLNRIGRSKLIAHNANFVLQIEKRQDENNYSDMIVHLIKSRRSENMIKGHLKKNLPCCYVGDEVAGSDGNSDDISQKLGE